MKLRNFYTPLMIRHSWQYTNVWFIYQDMSEMLLFSYELNSKNTYHIVIKYVESNFQLVCEYVKRLTELYDIHETRCHPRRVRPDVVLFKSLERTFEMETTRDRSELNCEKCSVTHYVLAKILVSLR